MSQAYWHGKKNVTVWLDQQTLDCLDEMRGERSRNSFVGDLIKRKVIWNILELDYDQGRTSAKRA